MDFDQCLSKMCHPGARRRGIWREGVIQIKVTNACDLSCSNCTVGVGFAKKLHKIFYMSPTQFRAACRSLRGYHGVIGMFGGNPCIHPQFEELCDVFRQEVPDIDQRGLWSNRLFGHGPVCQKTFCPEHSNLNVHGNRDAYEEMKAGWPECKPLIAGTEGPSQHSPIWGSMLDLGLTESEMWSRVSQCYVNQTWSAEITVIRGELHAFFCEIAATMAELEGSEEHGSPVVPGWWKASMHMLQAQVKAYCTRCLIPMNGKKVLDAGGVEEYTEVWKPLMLTIKGRPLEQVASVEFDDSPATKYLSHGVMRA